LGEDNSDPIKVHPEFNSGSSPQPSIRALATEFSKNFGREDIVSISEAVLLVIEFKNVTLNWEQRINPSYGALPL